MLTSHALPAFAEDLPIAPHWAPTEPAPLDDAPRRSAAPARLPGAWPHLPAPAGRAPRLINHLMAARSERECAALVRAALHGCGFDWYVQFRLECGPAGLRVHGLVDTHALKPWVQRYAEAGYQQVDPRLQRLVASRLPVRWDCGDLERQALASTAADAPRHLALVDDLCAAGMFSGAMFTVAGPDAAGTRIVASLGSARPEGYWMTGSVMGRALAFALNMHEFLTHHGVRFQGPGRLSAQELEQVRARLTPLQRAVLDGFEQGLDDLHIGRHLGVPGEVVEDYRRQLQWHFDGRQRALLDVGQAAPARA